MLIVGREIGQSVVIGDVVKVTILKYGSKLKLNINAPNNMRITPVKENPSSRFFKKGVKKIGDTVRTGNSVTVTVLQTENRLLRFAIDAPKEISIYREELYENQLAAQNQNVVMN